MHRHEVESPLLLPQGSSLLPELCCLGPSSLNRPHPPHSWAHRDFTAERLIRDVFAVRERRGDPRVVPSFRCRFLPDMPSSPTSRSSTSRRPSLRCRHGLRHELTGSTLPILPQNSFHAGAHFRGFTGSQLLGPVRLLASQDESDRITFSHRRLLRPGFRRVGHPPHRWI